MPVLHETAFAKINLALHVRGRREDGYHELDTLFAFVDAGDRVSGVLADTLLLKVDGPFGQDISQGADNLVLRAAHAVSDSFGTKQRAHITLDKRLPVASGIGGGSADAAAVARLLNRLWDLQASEADLAAILAPLGADIPACVASQTVRGKGIGTELLPLNSSVAGIPVLLVNPNLPLSTAAVFRAWDGVDHGGLGGGDVLEMALEGRNDLQTAAITLCPAIADVLTALTLQTPVMARMSGSGATCFALFKTVAERDEAQTSIRKVHPKYWTLSGRLR
jgi:4-diphosphocytidyl-2-C-methyl-D-erythritol kinase